ncbi:hypothetical protein B0H13DRAFT_1850897 [Mycena leptocephala]|nr:hypothetical protein B0H13DRAFT_1850897 [Mycena leptocephala]
MNVDENEIYHILRANIALLTFESMVGMESVRRLRNIAWSLLCTGTRGAVEGPSPTGDKGSDCPAVGVVMPAGLEYTSGSVRRGMTLRVLETKSILRFCPRDSACGVLSDEWAFGVEEEAVEFGPRCIDAEGEEILGDDKQGADMALGVRVGILSGLGGQKFKIKTSSSAPSRIAGWLSTASAVITSSVSRGLEKEE